MYLKSVEIENYKCFRKPTRLELDPGMNVIVGRNNVGKSALMEALELRFQNSPHIGQSSLRRRGDPVAPASRAAFRIECTPAEVTHFIESHVGTVHIPALADAPSNSGWRTLLAELEQVGSKPFLAGARGGDDGITFEDELFLGRYESDLENRQGARHWHALSCSGYGARPAAGGGDFVSTRRKQALDSLLFARFRQNVYRFDAGRLGVGQCAFGDRHKLLSDASNLPEVLNVLQANPARFRRYNAFVLRVLPQVRWISVRPSLSEKATVEVLVWSHVPDTERDDLAIPLLKSGTGVSQVLAMLYVVITADTPKTIIIDEPNSFLHPGGVAALLQVFKEHPDHQYILSTHSPAVITEAEPKRVYILENEANEARLVPVDPGDVTHQRDVLDAVGARLGDVFGPDRILWVEGKTEERAFPLIVRRLSDMRLTGTRILGVVNTGDFDRKLVRTSVEVYRRLSQGIGLVPAACGFLFDREKLSEEDCQRLSDACAGKLVFLPRRMYENYLVDPEAVAAVMGAGLPEDPRPSPASVREWLDAKRNEFRGPGTEIEVTMDGARLLGALFSELSGTRLAYDKVVHGTALTEWLLSHRPEALSEVGDLLAQMLPADATKGA